MHQLSSGECWTRKRLGERLVEQGLISGRQLDMALEEQKRASALLGETLVRLDVLSPRGLSQALADQGGVPFLELASVTIPVSLSALVPEGLARRLRVLPLQREGRDLLLAMANIFDMDALAEVEKLTGLRVRIACATEEDIQARISLVYGGGPPLEAAIEEAIRLAGADRGAIEEDLPAVGLVDQLLAKAIRDRATDVHIQPSEHTVLTRFRVDGSLMLGPSLPKALQQPIIARLKIMAGVDIAEARLPQDGKFQIPRGRFHYDVRASFLPALHGEKVVLRILDKSSLILGLDQLGMPERVLERFRAMLSRPHGVILVTGPTGSGKTTTLYSALHNLNTSDRCILTIEDPVEYQLPLISQVSLNLKAGLTFATGLRAILRQDPDIILVGEIRDAETAAITLRAAMTGHLVLSTLHTNDPVGAIPRLREMGIPVLELAAALLGVHAQRLVRLNCQACALPLKPPAALPGGTGEDLPAQWKKGAGCSECGFSGIRGRRAIHDLLPMTARLRELIAAGATTWDLEAHARACGKRSLFDHALDLARAGLITPDEALRVKAEDD